MSTKKKIKSVLDEIEGLLALWGPRLFLYEWEFMVVPMQEEDEGGAVLRVDADPAYFRGIIYVAPSFVRMSKQAKEEAVLHELCHCLNSEVTRLLEQLMDGRSVSRLQMVDAVERLTQRTTRILLTKTR